MRAKTLVTVLLLLFVGVSVGALVVKEVRGRSVRAQGAAQAASAPAAAPGPAPSAVAVSPETPPEAPPAATPAQAAAQPAAAPEPPAAPPASATPAPAAAQAEPAPAAAPKPPAAPAPATPAAAPAAAPQRKVLALYLHRTRRCPTCRKIESYSQEALSRAFPEALATGRLEWRAVNIEEPGNEFYLQKYQLAVQTLVLAEYVGGREGRWKSLPQVWELVGDKVAFQDFVRDETRAFLEGTPEPGG